MSETQRPPPTTAGDATHTRGERKPSVVLLSMLTAFGALSIDIVLPALPDIAQALGTPLSRIQLVIGVFFAGMGLGQIFWGWLSDWRGRRPAILGGLAGYSAASVLCAVAGEDITLIAARAAQGFCAAAPVAIARAVVRDFADGKEAARALATIMVVFFLTPICAPLLGTLLLGFMSWQATLAFCGAFGGVVITLTALYLPETLAPDQRARRSFGELIDVGIAILTHPQSRGTMLALIAITGGLASYLALGPLVFQGIYGFSASLYAWLFALIATVQMLSSLLCRWLLKHLSLDSVFEIGVGICVSGGAAALIASTYYSDTTIPVIAAVMAYMCGFSFVLPNATAKALSPFGAMAGAASAMLGAWQTVLGGSYSAALGSSFKGAPNTLGIALCGAGIVLIIAVFLNRKAIKDAEP